MGRPLPPWAYPGGRLRDAAARGRAAVRLPQSAEGPGRAHPLLEVKQGPGGGLRGGPGARRRARAVFQPAAAGTASSPRSQARNLAQLRCCRHPERERGVCGAFTFFGPYRASAEALLFFQREGAGAREVDDLPKVAQHRGWRGHAGTPSRYGAVPAPVRILTRLGESGQRPGRSLAIPTRGGVPPSWGFQEAGGCSGCGQGHPGRSPGLLSPAVWGSRVFLDGRKGPRCFRPAGLC